ncbi:DUF4012 domain-containing protein, partial [Patescibacteria group bacterium]|nr:DUF4012 domain-containing protein [Patescibacteria group bacterium]
KVCLLFEHPLEKNLFLEPPLSLLDKPFLLDKIVCILPLTSAIETSDNLAVGWKKQVELEVELAINLSKKIDASRFIFYTDLVKKNLSPTQYFLSQLEQKILLDPGIELTLQTTQALAARLAVVILSPQQETKIIEGKHGLSKVYVQKIREVCDRYHQIRLPIRQAMSRVIKHPILELVMCPMIETTTESSDEISRAIARFIGFSATESQEEAKRTLTRPLHKAKLYKTWNQIKRVSQVIVLTSNDSVSGQKTSVSGQKMVEKTFKSEIDESKTINTLFSSLRQYQKQDHLNQMTKKTRLGFRKLKHRKFLFLGGMGISVTALGLLVLICFFMINVTKIQTRFLDYLNSRSLPITAQEKKIAQLKKNSASISGRLGFINQLFPIAIFSQAQQISEATGFLLSLTEQAAQFQSTTNLLYQEVMGQAESSSFLTLEKANQEVEQVFRTISLLQAELKNYSVDKLNPTDRQLVEQYQQYLADQEKSLSQYQQLSSLFPLLLGQDQRQVYAIVLQNNHELRPTGGFIQAVAFLTFNQGKLINVQVEDVYGLDQKLKGIKEPPADLKQLLGEKRWFLRDSNWSPDFPESAEQIRWFIDKSLGVSVDGVIGINIRVLEEMLGVLEQLNIEEHNEVLTKKNLDERMEFHSEVQLIDTAQNRDYAELILFKLIDALKILPQEKIVPLLSSLVKMANHKELLVAVFDSNIQSSFYSLGWSGALIQPECPAVFGETNCVVDMIAQVEANIGVNKANYYLERQIDDSILLLPEQVIHKRIISFKNKAQTNAWPKGPYKAYTRFYLPQNAQVKSIKINDHELGLEQMIKNQELNRQVVGVLTETAVKAETKLQLEYSLPYQQQTPFTYVFFDQKQPGARNSSPRVFLQHAPDLSPTLIAPQAEVQGDVIVFNPSKDTGHMFVGVTVE